MATEQEERSLEERVRALEESQRELRERLREQWRQDLERALKPLYDELQDEKGIRHMLDERLTECLLALDGRLAGIEGRLAGGSPRRDEVDAIIAKSQALRGGNVGANFVACLEEADALFADPDALPDEGQLDALSDAWKQALGALPRPPRGRRAPRRFARPWRSTACWRRSTSGWRRPRSGSPPRRRGCPIAARQERGTGQWLLRIAHEPGATSCSRTPAWWRAGNWR